jgi:hypothetical protein
MLGKAGRLLKIQQLLTTRQPRANKSNRLKCPQMEWRLHLGIVLTTRVVLNQQFLRMRKSRARISYGLAFAVPGRKITFSSTR